VNWRKIAIALRMLRSGILGAKDLLSRAAKGVNCASMSSSPSAFRLAILAFLLVTSSSAFAQEPTRQDSLLDHLTGSWTLQGTIAGHETTHDIESEWVLNHEYLQLHETSRGKNAQGQPAYEAIVFIEWDKSSNEYKCLWLDSTSGGGLSAPIAQGKRGNDEITFFFRDKDKDKDNAMRGDWRSIIMPRNGLYVRSR